MIFRDVLEYKTKSEERLDITKDVQAVVEKYSIQEGLCNIFLKGTTAALTINEDDMMLMADIKKMLARIAPPDKFYQHPENAHSHLRSILMNNCLSIPIANGKLLLGTWQSILLWEFDVEERDRMIVVTMIGG
jgi:secondary thiamine-phosphate synthase enzyme